MEEASLRGANLSGTCCLRTNFRRVQFSYATNMATALLEDVDMQGAVGISEVAWGSNASVAAPMVGRT